MAPMYLQERLNAKTPGRFSQSSDALGLLVVPVTTCKTFRDRTFGVWNSLPFSIRNNASIESFKRNLKSFFFLCSVQLIYSRFSHDVTTAMLVPKTKKRRPCWCPDQILREFNSIIMQTLPFVFVEKHGC